MASAVHEGLQEATRLFRKRVLGSVARSVDPPDLPTRRGRSQRVQHGEHRRCPNAGAEQDDWSIAGSQSETAPRRAHLQNIARVYVIVKIRADNPVRLSFDAYPISFGAGHA